VMTGQNKNIIFIGRLRSRTPATIALAKCHCECGSNPSWEIGANNHG
jgi:hypothetical protein